MNYLELAYCNECEDLVRYDIEEEVITEKFKGQIIKYKFKVGKCKECGCEVATDIGYNSRKSKAKLEAYKTRQELITLKLITEILRKYDISKEGLADIAGFGKVTIKRYYDGIIPSREYSDILFNILNKEQYFMELVEKNKEKLKNIIMDNLIEAIKQLKKEKNAIILGHYYQKGEIQDIADYVGDSLALAQWAARTEADIIVMCGVHFMGETAKVLCPDKKVLVPDMAAGCSLADSCPADKFSQFVKEHPGYTVISYVNTTAAVKAVTDVVVTSTNAKQIVESFPKDEKIIFGPDRNLGNYINSITGRNMLLWDGACHVHEEFSVEKIVEIKRQHPDAVVLAHPECKSTVLKLADVVGSTAALLKYAVAHPEKSYIVATESGILHEMQKQCPQTTFIPAPPNDSTCACNECSYMRLNTLEKLYDCLKNESPEIKVDAEIAEKAVKPIKRMLEISAQLGL